MTIGELREELDRFPDETLILLGSLEIGKGYYPNFNLRPFDSKEDLCIIGHRSPYVSIPFNVIESGWRPV